MTFTTSGLFACEKVSFEKPFNGGQDVKVFVSKTHATKSSTGRNGAAVWVESVNNNEFTFFLFWSTEMVLVRLRK